MPRPCSVCGHESRQAIDEALLVGETFKAVTERHGPSRQALARHLKFHLSRSLKRAQEVRAREKRETRHVAAVVEREESRDESLLSKLDGLEEDARRILAKAEEAEDYRSAMAGIRELRGVFELIARVTGEIRPETAQVNVVALDEETAVRVAETYLRRRGRLPAAPIEARARELPEAPEDPEEGG